MISFVRGVIVGGIGVSFIYHPLMVVMLAIILVVPLVVFQGGVLLPEVWSRHKWRRKAAAKVRERLYLTVERLAGCRDGCRSEEVQRPTRL